MNGTCQVNGRTDNANPQHIAALAAYKPYDLSGVVTYDLVSRPSKVFHDELGQPASADSTLSDWLNSLPKQLAANDLRRVSDHLVRAYKDGRTGRAAIGGHVIKTGCAPYLIDWINRGLLKSLSMNGAAAIHDLELAVGGKTSENVSLQLPTGQFGMARETADAFAVAARNGANHELGLGWALGRYLESCDCPYGESSLLLAAFRAGIPCTVHVAIGTDIVTMHPHVCGASLGEASLIDFRRLCTVVSTMKDGVWLNLGSAVVLPEVFMKTVAVARNFGHCLDGLVTVNMDKQVQYRSRVNVVERPGTEGIELIGHHEILLPLLHAAVTCKLGAIVAPSQSQAA